MIEIPAFHPESVQDYRLVFEPEPDGARITLYMDTGFDGGEIRPVMLSSYLYSAASLRRAASKNAKEEGAFKFTYVPKLEMLSFKMLLTSLTLKEIMKRELLYVKARGFGKAVREVVQ